MRGQNTVNVIRPDVDCPKVPFSKEASLFDAMFNRPSLSQIKYHLGLLQQTRFNRFPTGAKRQRRHTVSAVMAID
jgi:hypothetical protein